MASVILPRIKNITSQRKSIIGSDLASADSINESTSEIQARIEELTFRSNLKYKTTLEESAKKAAAKRDLLLADFKEKSEKLIKDATDEIEKTIKNSKEASQGAASKLTEVIQNKIFN